jgi:hypothetical protein
VLTKEKFAVSIAIIIYTSTLPLWESIQMTKLLRFTIPSAVAALLGLATAPVQAAAMIEYFDGTSVVGGPITLTNLFNSGAYIKIDEDGDGTFDKLFEQWINGKNGMNIIPSMVSDDVTVTGFGSTLSAGLQYDAGPAAFSQNFSADFGYTLTVLPTTLLLGGAKLELTSSTATGGVFNLVQITGGFTAPVVPAAGTGVYNSNGLSPLAILTSSVVFTPAVLSTSVSNMLNGSAVGIPALGLPEGTSKISQFKQTFTQIAIPEPGTVVGLLAAGGLGLAMKRRQKDS